MQINFDLICFVQFCTVTCTSHNIIPIQTEQNLTFMWENILSHWLSLFFSISPTSFSLSTHLMLPPSSSHHLNENMIKLQRSRIAPMSQTLCEIYIFSLLPSPFILGGDKSTAIYDSFVAAGRPLLSCLAVIPADSFRSVSLFKSCCNYTGFSICRRPDMIQTTTAGQGGERGAQRVNGKGDKAQWWK